ncbi:DUF4405 domain-containing protein [Adlercreutzia sp. ZJ154]|uniref:DUF4405 domain-containing protein n=1 Tax=Adlercreutzia sp. ZJ154 TaxID=2709790 RepID=UPI0013EB30B6|nr:DUF4405 domain-containing protein [Adlercreutzia sp. ZJ154]
MTKRTVIVDVVLLILYLVSAFPVITGIPLHEWIGIFATLALIVHCAKHGIANKQSLSSSAKIGRLVLNVLIAASLIVCAVSGIMVSGTVLLTFGLYADGYYFWDPLHAISAKVFMACLFVHIVININVARHLWKTDTHASTTGGINANNS